MFFEKTIQPLKKINKLFFSKIPKGQTWLIEKMQALGYEPKGKCFGIAQTAVAHVLLKSLKDFDHVFDIISSSSKNNFADKIKTTKEKGFLNISDSLESIEAYQHPNKVLSKFFLNSERPTFQDFKAVRRFVLPKKLKDQGGIADAVSFSGIYDRSELTAYFESLRKAVKKVRYVDPLALVLKNNNHAITIGYYPDIKKWVLIDANHLPTKYITKCFNLVTEVLHAFCNTEIAVFSTILSVAYPNAKQLDAIVKALQVDEIWKIIHSPTVKRLQQVDSNGISWLYIAITQNQFEILKELLKAGANPNEQLKNGMTTLEIADKLCQFRSEYDAVRILLHNISFLSLLKDNDKTSYRFKAITNCYKKCFAASNLSEIKALSTHIDALNWLEFWHYRCISKEKNEIMDENQSIKIKELLDTAYQEIIAGKSKTDIIENFKVQKDQIMQNEEDYQFCGTSSIVY
jgi:hypothetical protein